MVKKLLAAFALLALVACATPKTPAQTVYALEAQYAAAANMELGYISSPNADQKIVDQIKMADNTAYNALVQAEAAVRTNNDPALAQAAVTVATGAIAQLNQLLMQNGAH